MAQNINLCHLFTIIETSLTFSYNLPKMLSVVVHWLTLDQTSYFNVCVILNVWDNVFDINE